MRIKLRLHSWEYFKENHHVGNDGRVWKYRASRKPTYLTKEIVDVRMYETRHSSPGPYTITIENTWNLLARAQDVRVLSWMIDEVFTEEDYPEHFI